VHRHAIADITARHGAHQVSPVGSVAGGDHRATRDIDLLVTLDKLGTDSPGVESRGHGISPISTT
jgi:hypothetical protein